jgi:hypothetical protein
MSSPISFLSRETEFESWRNLVAGVLNDETRLPESPFTKRFSRYSFEEFDWMLSADCWPVLVNLAKASGDTNILVAVLEPDPVRYFKTEFGVYNWAVLPMNVEKDAYWTFLNLAPGESPADSVLANSETVLWMPPSQKWVIWGERSSGLCVLASEINTVVWKDIEWANEICLQGESSGFAEKLKRAFCAS